MSRHVLLKHGYTPDTGRFGPTPSLQRAAITCGYGKACIIEIEFVPRRNRTPDDLYESLRLERVIEYPDWYLSHINLLDVIFDKDPLHFWEIYRFQGPTMSGCIFEYTNFRIHFPLNTICPLSK